MAKTKRNKQDDWEMRCAELELVVQACSAAFEVIPIWALEKEQQWHPSAEAIRLLKRAKDSVIGYSTDHWHTGRNI